MVQRRYPVFVEGQTLTHETLDMLRDHLRDRDRTLGRLVGFGVVSGLQGEVRTDGLHLSPGLAVDQRGEPLLVETETVLPLPPSPGTATFEFVTGTEGFTVVLALDDVTEPSPGCDEAGCAGHAELHRTEVAVHTVAGRLDVAEHDFSKEALIVRATEDGSTRWPLGITQHSAVSGDFDALRAVLLDRIGADLGSRLRTKLAGLVVEPKDLPAVKAYKAAFLNAVLFAALDLLRFRALVAVPALRTTSTPGVALGWLHQTGAGWAFAEVGRHRFEPPTGVTLTLLGGPGDDPAQPYVDRLVSLVDTFALPPVPKQDDPPKRDPGPFVLCEHRHGKVLGRKHACNILRYPKEDLRDWDEYYVGTQITGPGYIDPVPPEVIYHDDPLDLAGGGVIDLLNAFGGRADEVQVALEQTITASGVQPNVLVRTEQQALSIDGYSPAGAVSPSDVVVLVSDAQDKVVGTGRVPAARSLREIGTAVPAAKEAARIAGTLGDAVTDARGRLTSAEDGLRELTGKHDQTTVWREGVDRTLDGLDGTVRAAATSAVSGLRLELTTALSGLVREEVGGIRAGLVDQFRAEVQTQVTTGVGALRRDLETQLSGGLAAVRREIDTQVTKGVGDLRARVDSQIASETGTLRAEITSAVTAQVAAVRQDLGGQLSTAIERTGRVESLLQNNERLLSTATTRIDDLYKGTKTFPRGVADGGQVVDPRLLSVLDTMRESVEAAAAPERREQVRGALDPAGQVLDRLKQDTEAGVPTVAAPQDLGLVLDSFVDAVRAAGAPRTQVVKLQRETQAFKSALPPVRG